MKEIFKKYGFILCAVLHFILCAVLSYYLSFVDVFASTESSVCYIIFLVLMLPITILLWKLLFTAIKKIKQKNELFLKFVKNFLIFFCVCFFIYLLIYPGVWYNDEFTILAYARRFILYGWHHTFTEVFFDTAMFFFIHPSLIILFQLIIISCIVSYLVTDIKLLISEKLNFKSKWLNLIWIPFFLFPTIIQVMNALRLTLYSFIELFILYDVFTFSFKNKKLSFKRAIIWGVSTAIVSFWRSESIFFIILIPIIIFVKNKKLIAKKVVAVFLSSLIAFSAFIYIPQKISLSKSSLDTSFFPEVSEESLLNPVGVNDTNGTATYNTAYIVTTFRELHKKYIIAANKKGDTETLEKFSEFYDVDTIIDTQKMSLDCVNYEAIESNKTSYYLLTISSTLKYFGQFLEYRFSRFYLTNTKLFIEDTTKIDYAYYYFDVYEYLCFPGLRSAVINILRLAGYAKPNVLSTIVYNLVFPFLLIFIFIIIEIVSLIKNKKKKEKINPWYLILLLTILIKNLIIFFTTPGRYFMYYFGLYIEAYTILVINIILAIKRHRIKIANVLLSNSPKKYKLKKRLVNKFNKNRTVILNYKKQILKCANKNSNYGLEFYTKKEEK